MKYFVLPILLVIFTELLGTIFANYFKINSFKFNGILGFIIILAIFYVISFPLVLLNANFSLLFIVSALIFTFISIWMLKNWKYFQTGFKTIDIILVLSFVVIQIYMASRNSLGSLWRFDTVTYSNFITGMIYGENLNAIDWMNGFPATSIKVGYAFQGYYKFASVAIYLFNGIYHKLGLDFLYFTQYVWLFPFMLYTYMAELIVNFVDKFRIQKWYTHAFIVLFIIYFMGNFYWNSEQAYLGNSFRMLITSYGLFYIWEYFADKNQKYLVLLGLINYANASCANTNSTLVLIMVFALWCVIDDKENNLRLLLIGVYLPLMNCLFQAIGLSTALIVMVTCLLVLLGVFENRINAIVLKFKLKTVSPIFIFFLLFLLSLNITHNVFDFSDFLNNMSGWADMTWDYTDWSNLWRSLANIVYVILIVAALYKYRKESTTIVLIIVTLVFFTPFTAAFQNKYMIVYYRNYDIVINYFTLFLGIKALEESDFYGKPILFVVLCLVSLYFGYNQFNYHQDYSFTKSDDYHEVFKMDYDQVDVLFYMKNLASKLEDSHIKVISYIFQLRTEIPQFRTLYNRSKEFNGLAEDEELYKIFYPYDYYGDPYQPPNPQYEYVDELLRRSDYEYLIQDKTILYDYDDTNGKCYYLWYKICDCKCTELIYENNTYAVFKIYH